MDPEVPQQYAPTNQDADSQWQSWNREAASTTAQANDAAEPGTGYGGWDHQTGLTLPAVRMGLLIISL